MRIFRQNFKIRVSVIILISLIILTTVLLSIADLRNKSTQLALCGSLAAGLIIAAIQFLISWQDFQETEKLKELSLIKVLYRRDDRTFYSNYIASSTEIIQMMGVSAFRFFNDFADSSPNAPESAKVFIRAIERRVIVKILLPTRDYLEESKKDDFDRVNRIINELQTSNLNTLFEVKYFNHIPSHSIFNVDSSTIVGPVFPELESKYTPALYLKNSSPIAQKYLKHFENEWDKATKLA